MPKFDNISREHDIAYDKIKHNYLEHGDKQAHLKQIHEADDKFINDAKKEGIKGKIASNLIKFKNMENIIFILIVNAFRGLE